MGRMPCCDKANVKKGPWSPEEDAKLKAYIEEHGTGGNWIALPQKIGLKRCGKSCRLRWLNYLRPNIKHGGFSDEEDQIICSLYISIGSRWSIIAAQLPGRTDNDIKNYWNTRLKKKMLGKRRDPLQSRSLSPGRDLQEEANGINGYSSSQALSASALERMQLHMQLQGLYNPYSFYNHPALWPKHRPFSGGLLESQLTDAVIATPVQQPGDGASTSMDSNMPNAMSTTMQEEFENSNLGFSSHSVIGSEAVGVQDELHDLLYGKDGGPGGQAAHQLSYLDCFKEIDEGKESMNWWASNGFEENSSPSSWDSASASQNDAMMIQEFMLGYDLE